MAFMEILGLLLSYPSPSRHRTEELAMPVGERPGWGLVAGGAGG